MAAITKAVLNGLPSAVSIGKAGEVEVQWDKLPQDAVTYLLHYGMKQALQDAGAGADDKRDKAQRKLDSLYAGQVKMSSGSGGATLDAKEKATRDVFTALMTETFGYKKGNVSKPAKSAKGREDMIREAVQHRKPDADAETIEQKVAEIQQHIDGKAENLKAAYEAPDLDI